MIEIEFESIKQIDFDSLVIQMLILMVKEIFHVIELCYELFEFDESSSQILSNEVSYWFYMFYKI